MARSLNLPEPIATVELTSMLYLLDFAAACEDKLEFGVSQKSVAEQRKIIEMHKLLKEGATFLDGHTRH